MSWRRSKSNALTIREERRRREQMRRTVDARIAEMSRPRGGAR